jgi:hypothetical protein
MNRKPTPEFDPSSPLLRKAFAVMAVAATFATAQFIEALAEGYGMSPPIDAGSAPVVVAQR